MHHWPFGVVGGGGVGVVISHFFQASILPSSHYTINPFLPIILVQKSKYGKELLLTEVSVCPELTIYKTFLRFSVLILLKTKEVKTQFAVHCLGLKQHLI